MDRHGELTGIQFLRGFCAIGVVIGHCAAMLAKPKYGGLTLLGGALESGSLGVDIFFVISGFIIAVVVLRGPDLQPIMTMTEFAKRRLVRIVPMMWLAIMSYAVLQHLFARDLIDVPAYVRAFFLVPYSYVKPDIIWTLRQEIIFYLLFLLSFFGHKYLRLIIVAWVFSPIAYVAQLGSMSATTAYIDTFGSVFFSSVNLEFGMGLALGIIWTCRSPRGNWRLFVHPFLVIACLLAAIVGLSWSSGLVSQSLPGVAFMGLSGGLLVSLSARSFCPPGWLTSFGRLLGDASYSVYLFHLHILAGLLALRVKLGFVASAPFLIGAVVLAATALSIILHVYVERPLLRWIRERLDRRNYRAGGAVKAAIPPAV